MGAQDENDLSFLAHLLKMYVLSITAGHCHRGSVFISPRMSALEPNPQAMVLGRGLRGHEGRPPWVDSWEGRQEARV